MPKEYSILRRKNRYFEGTCPACDRHAEIRFTGGSVGKNFKRAGSITLKYSQALVGNILNPLKYVTRVATNQGRARIAFCRKCDTILMVCYTPFENKGCYAAFKFQTSPENGHCPNCKRPMLK